jgi:hypothetical protein
MTRFALLLPPPALLPGCIVPVPLPPGTPGAVEIVFEEGDPCGATRLQSLVGEPGFYIEDTRFQSPVPVRLLRPGEAAGAANPSG